ncbi:aminoacyl--tRNA ligase-related protein [Buchnera aphidicola (Ceratovacuna keduensis)]|uniref:aminoacyl--tRNA ligase-related protein n=1 Tax=Buchnera aphidicola TaxID=9 RepID=UPI0031B84CEB
MRTSKYLFFVRRKKNEKKTNINELMLQSGLIRKISSGIYVFLPLGVRIIRKIEKIVRKEMEKNNAIEIIMPILQPLSLWKKSGREKIFGNELFKVLDRKKKFFILSPTHEEISTYIFSKEIKSYKKLPIIFYQIQTKYRDEIRPKSGTIRCKEFIMKDAYSFHIKNKSMKKTYLKIYNSYINIFNSLKIKFYIIKTESKKMGGNISHEFHSISNSGENYILISNKNNIAKKIYIKKIIKKNKNINIKTKKKNNFVKIFLIKSYKNKNYILAIIHKNCILDIKKIKNYYKDNTIKLKKKKKLKNIFKKKNSIIIDSQILKMKSFYIYKKVNKTKKIKIHKNDKNILLREKYKIKKSIEIAHIFQIGKKYSNKINFFVEDKKKNKKIIKMGCYGIGISRLIPSIIEQNYDKNGIIWPSKISPFKVIILPINKYKETKVNKVSEKIYKKLKKNNIEVIIEDRVISPGKMFFESELIGITHIIIINKKNLKNKCIEYKNRISNIKKLISIKKIKKMIKKKLFF